VLAMARPTELEKRVRAILALHRPRVQARATRFAAVATIFSGALVALAGHSPDGTALSPRPAVARERSATIDRGQDRERATLDLALDSRPDVVPALIAALDDPDAQVREKAALGLGWRSDNRVIAPLVIALGDADAQVREKAAIALGSSGNARAAAPLEAAREDDPDGEVREKAAAGLSLLRAGGNPEANGKQVRDALNLIVGGLRRLTQ
jgi:HEAT repeat protein